MFGVLNLNKPAGITSRDCVNVVQRIVRPLKVGHAGTLDPMATGVLLVCVGPATRLISLLQQQKKTYAATFRLGLTSDTDDSTGQTTSTWDGPAVSQDLVVQELQSFVGCIQQVPPAYSAVKVDGQRAYRKARQGESFELKAKSVQIERLEVTDFCWPDMRLTIECGSGTYIRSIARDLGQRLGCGGVMTELQRTAIGGFSASKAVDPQNLTADNLSRWLHDPLQVLSDLPIRRCTEAERSDVQRGRKIPLGEVTSRRSPAGSATDASVTHPILLASADGQQLLALAELKDNDAWLQPRAVFDRPATT